MNHRYFIYALFVTVVSTWASWGSLIKSSSGAGTGRGSSWSSGGGYYGGGSGSGGSGGHK